MTHTRSTVACLMVHGLNGSPHDFEDVAAHLEEQCITTERVLLPGHEMTAREAERFGWNDWTEYVHASFTRLADKHACVAIVGHSMGGALALHVAARDPRVAAVATLCAPAELHTGLVSVVGLGRFVMPYLPVFREDISDRLVRHSYRQRKVSQWVSLAPMYTLLRALPALRAELPKVCCPALIMAARNDHVVPVRDGRYIFSHIGSTAKELVILDRSWHVVTRDVERETVTAHLARFLQQVAENV